MSSWAMDRDGDMFYGPHSKPSQVRSHAPEALFSHLLLMIFVCLGCHRQLLCQVKSDLCYNCTETVLWSPLHQTTRGNFYFSLSPTLPREILKVFLVEVTSVLHLIIFNPQLKILLWPNISKSNILCIEV